MESTKKMTLIGGLLITIACSTYALSGIKGVYSPTVDELSQSRVDTLLDCAKRSSNRYAQLDGLSINVDNKMDAMGLSLNPDNILVRTRDDVNSAKLSWGTIAGIILHEFSHIYSWRSGNGPDSYHTQWASGELEIEENKIVLCAEIGALHPNRIHTIISCQLYTRDIMETHVCRRPQEI